MIRGTTSLILHLGYPTHSFKAPLILNPYFGKHGIDAAIIPVGIRREDYTDVFPALFRAANVEGALVTMPHKITTVGMVDEVTRAVEIAGACNGVLRRPDGSLLGDLFDGEGFVRAMERHGRSPAAARVFVVGAGGVGSAIAASLAEHEVAELHLVDVRPSAADRLAERLAVHFPALAVSTGPGDPAGFDVVVNATPLGMNEGDPFPVDVSGIDVASLVADVVMSRETTPFLQAAKERGCAIQRGTEMLLEQLPAYLDFFGLRGASADELRATADIPC